MADPTQYPQQPPPQQAYPEKTDIPPQQPGYPPQQPGYPPQQPGYPPQQPGYQPYPPDYKGAPLAAPPPYAMQPPPVQQQQQSSNVVVVQGQPQMVQTQVVHQRHYGSGDHGLVLAIIASFCVFFFGWWIGFACTIPAIFIALNAQEAEGRGDTATMQSQQKLSQGLSIAGMVSGVLIYVIWILAVIIYYATLTTVRFTG